MHMYAQEADNKEGGTIDHSQTIKGRHIATNTGAVLIFAPALFSFCITSHKNLCFLPQSGNIF